jgi:hypothetical protein
MERLVEKYRHILTLIRSRTPDEIGFPISTKDPSEYNRIPFHAIALQTSIKHGLVPVTTVGNKVKYMFIRKRPDGFPMYDDAGKVIDTIVFTDKFPEGFGIDYARVEERIIDMKIGPLFDDLYPKPKSKKIE